MNEDFFRVRDVASRLGVSPERVYQLIAAGELPAVRVGNAWRVPVAAYEEWLQKKAQEAASNAK